MLVTDSAARRRLTICGLGELCSYQASAVTHVLSILDPGYPDPEDFSGYGPHRRLTLRFHDIIEPAPGHIVPRADHIEELLRFGQDLARDPRDPLDHLLVHCHAGISRSTAAMSLILAQAHPERSADEIFAEVVGACRKLSRRPHDRLDRPQFHALLTCARPKQSPSSRFCSHTVHAPAKPKPLRSHSMASKP